MRKSKYQHFIEKVDPKILKTWKDEQDYLKQKLIEKDEINELKYIAGMDISASTYNPNIAVVAIVIYEYESMKFVYEKYEFVKMTQPYVPGFLAFREVDHLVGLIKNLDEKIIPQVILIDGNGILHSNRFGLACHLGVITGIPTIGCGKTIFAVDGINKRKIQELSKLLKLPGESINLVGNSGEIWGAALKSTEYTINPMIISIGHKVSLETALKIVKKCIKYRVPEPIRIADKNSRAIIEEYNYIGETFDIENYLKNSF